MQLENIDWLIISAFFVISLLIGVIVSKKSGKDITEFFLSGRKMPWWLLGISMVATTFSADTPNLVTDIVRTNGVAGNWVWWAFLLTGMLTVFIYAKLWRRSKVLTDLEFYELRYSGKGAAFLRGFRAFYLGAVFNVLIMASVCLAGIKIGGALLGLSPVETLLISCGITVIYSSIGGLRGIIITDFFQFILAMLATFWAAYEIVSLPQIQGLTNLLNHPDVIPKLSLIPDIADRDLFIAVFIIPLAVQWWAVWYPGAEPGGGGYIAQRMLAAKSENHALGATLFFNIMHYALRPWPWILVALASLIIFPDLDSIRETFPNVVEDKIGHDLAYPAMLTLLPSGLLGFVLASLVSAYMSTISTHLNWGSSYVVNDFYKQLINKNASEKELVNVGRVSVVILMIISSIFAIALTNSYQLFDIILMFGAGTGSIFILRWFWWRINAWSEIAAMLSSGLISILFANEKIASAIFNENFIEPYFKFPVIVLITTIVWLLVTFMTKPDDDQKLIEFYKKTRPGGPGWKRIVNLPDFKNEKGYNKTWAVPRGILCMLVGCLAIYSALFSTGYFIYGELYLGLIMLSSTIIFSILLFNLSKTLFND